MVLEQLSPGRREVVTSGGERDRRRAWTYDITPPQRNGFQTFPCAQQGERQSGGGVGCWWGEEEVEEEGLETEVDTGARVVQVEQEDREQTPPLPQELCVWTLWAPGTERTLERALTLLPPSSPRSSRAAREEPLECRRLFTGLLVPVKDCIDGVAEQARRRKRGVHEADPIFLSHV